MRSARHCGMEIGQSRSSPMTPEQLQLLRKLAVNEPRALHKVMSGDVGNHGALHEPAATVVRIAALLSVNADPSTFQWAVELGIAAGVDDTDVFNTVVAVAPIIGMARLTSALPHLLRALDLEVVED